MGKINKPNEWKMLEVEDWQQLEIEQDFNFPNHAEALSELEVAIDTIENCDAHLEKAEFATDAPSLAKPIKVARASLQKEAGFLRDVIGILKLPKK